MQKTCWTDLLFFSFFFALDNMLKIQFGLNHYKCIGHTNNKMDYKSIYRSHMDLLENLKINYSYYSISSLFEP